MPFAVRTCVLLKMSVTYRKKIYNTVTDADVAALRGIIGSVERVIAGDAIGEDYSHDELSGVRRNPDVLIKVANAEEVAGVLKYANSLKLRLATSLL